MKEAYEQEATRRRAAWMLKHSEKSTTAAGKRPKVVVDDSDATDDEDVPLSKRRELHKQRDGASTGAPTAAVSGKLPPAVEQAMLAAYEAMNATKQAEEDKWKKRAEKAEKKMEEVIRDGESHVYSKQCELNSVAHERDRLRADVAALNFDVASRDGTIGELKADLEEAESKYQIAETEKDHAWDMCDKQTEVAGERLQRMLKTYDARRRGAKPLSEKSGCVACMCETAVWACSPCGHLVFCDKCKDEPSIASTERCPICREHHFGGDHGFLKIRSSGIDVYDE